VGGTIPVGDLRLLLEEVGFVEVEVVRKTGVSTSPHTVAIELRATTRK
jgi:hypothetical protein